MPEPRHWGFAQVPVKSSRKEIRMPLINLSVTGEPFLNIAMDIVCPLQRNCPGKHYPTQKNENMSDSTWQIQLISRVGIPSNVL